MCIIFVNYEEDFKVIKQRNKIMSNPVFQLATPEEARMIKLVIQQLEKKKYAALGLPTATTVQKVIREKNFFQKVLELQPKPLIRNIAIGAAALATLYAIRLSAPFVMQQVQSLYGRVKKWIGW